MKEHHTLFSEALQEDRAIEVYLPDSYQETDYAPMHYPVIYLLDGELYGDLVWTLITHLSATQAMPEVILVSIPSGETRFRDLTPTRSLIDWQGQSCNFLESSGGLAVFLESIEHTVVPYLENHYRTSPHRTLLGHSLAGLAVCQSLVSQATLFQGLVALDASLWWDQQWLLNNVDALGAETHQQTGNKNRRRFYCGYVDHEIGGPNDGQQIVRGNQRFMEYLQHGAGASLSIDSKIFKGETHQSICLAGFIAGLQFVFEGHRLPNGWAPNLAAVKAHYQQFSEWMGFDCEPPERLIDALAWGQYPKLERTVVLELLSDNLERFADSVHARSSLEQWRKITD